MELKNIVPWGRSLEEYRHMFLLLTNDLKSKILGCGDGPSSFNYEVTNIGGDVTSIDPIYKFSKKDIRQRIIETSKEVIEQLSINKDKYVWENIESIDALYNIRIESMNSFIEDYEHGISEGRYIYNTLPDLSSFTDKSFDIVLCSHFLFLYSKHLDLDFHIESILEMCRLAKAEVRVFPILDLESNKSKHLDKVLEVLVKNNYKYSIEKSSYEFQRNANQMLRISI
ncbi:SAM-dependent methyltransferase [Francisella philomiragia]|uniref:SAM-dependent methyltransferase n=1 Tax=Francisella philomiragia TaxID=28110 RepID=UPI000B5917AA|nr:SAM-dependent methyltransferase [Francisella philomiragia]MBK2094358.1 SAM-dependent methyltransferase [Francisella philomiragia]